MHTKGERKPFRCCDSNVNQYLAKNHLNAVCRSIRKWSAFHKQSLNMVIFNLKDAIEFSVITTWASSMCSYEQIATHVQSDVVNPIPLVPGPFLVGLQIVGLANEPCRRLGWTPLLMSSQLINAQCNNLITCVLWICQLASNTFSNSYLDDVYSLFISVHVSHSRQ